MVSTLESCTVVAPTLLWSAALALSLSPQVLFFPA